MNLLRKIGKWCWDKKERMVLVVMLVFLGYRIYTVIKVTDTIELDPMDPPSPTYSKEPEKPPRLNPEIEDVDLALLIRRRIFIWESPGKHGDGRDSINAEDQKLELLLIIKKDNGKHLARISTGGKKTLVREGAYFESYQLMSINIDTDPPSCVIYSENSNSNITVYLK